MTRLSRIRERLTLGRAIAEAERTPSTERDRAARSLALGRQRAHAAETLWARGDRAEALRLAVSAFDQTRAALVPRPPGPGPHEPGAPDAAPHDHALDSRDRDAVTAAVAARKTLEPPPAADHEIGPAHDGLYDALMRGRRALDDAATPRAATPDALRRTRAARWIGIALAALAVAAVVAWATRTPASMFAAASDYDGRHQEHQPFFAFDGDPSTEWWLLRGHEGWVEARIDPPQDIGAVTVTPGRGVSAAMDGPPRSIRDYRVELWRGNELLATDTGTNEAVDESPQPREHSVRAERVDRVRVVVESWHGPGGAIAEVAWE